MFSNSHGISQNCPTSYGIQKPSEISGPTPLKIQPGGAQGYIAESFCTWCMPGHRFGGNQPGRDVLRLASGPQYGKKEFLL